MTCFKGGCYTQPVFGSLGFQEIFFILVIALLVFGPKRLPEIGRTLGKALTDFRRATSDIRTTVENEIRRAEEPPQQVESRTPKADGG